MAELTPEDIEFAKEVLDEEVERTRDMEAQIGGLEAYIKRLQELRNKLAE